MSQYTDGFLLPLPKDKVEEYRTISSKAGQIWKDCGALEYREWIGDDLQVEGQMPFPKAVTASENETVVFAWITYESREHRDAVNAKVMADPRMVEMMAPSTCPFDYTRMYYGGFTNLVTA